MPLQGFPEDRDVKYEEVWSQSKFMALEPRPSLAASFVAADVAAAAPVLDKLHKVEGRKNKR